SKSAPEKAIETWKMANTLFKALTKRYSDRWKFVDFLGPNGRESAGIVDLLAIRKSSKQAFPKGLKKLDLFDIIVIQVKGGGARPPSEDDIRRLRTVAAHYQADKVVLFEWKKGFATNYYISDESSQWRKSSGDAIFGKPRAAPKESTKLKF
ncbi:MAG: hypothetical protein JNJ55_03825, partial [Betaproteobacteria bacterium]|nr:hypothetical protein [Betaproteobacteria bacterium]